VPASASDSRVIGIAGRDRPYGRTNCVTAFACVASTAAETREALVIRYWLRPLLPAAPQQIVSC